jgi:hypothetical protein
MSAAACNTRARRLLPRIKCKRNPLGCKLSLAFTENVRISLTALVGRTPSSAWDAPSRAAEAS